MADGTLFQSRIVDGKKE